MKAWRSLALALAWVLAGCANGPRDQQGAFEPPPIPPTPVVPEPPVIPPAG